LSSRSVAAIKRRIEYNQRYKEVFGDLRPKNPQMWTDSAFIVNRKDESKFPTLASAGLGGSGDLTGGGFDLIIADDIIDKANVETENQRRKSSEWFREVLLTTLFPWGAVYAIGSRWHHDDLYSELIKPEKEGGFGWVHQVDRAILNEQEVLVGAEPKVLWRDVWTYERLMLQKATIGSLAFDCEFQNNPTALEGKILKAEWLTSYTVLPHDLVYFAGVDPALGDGDQSAVSVVGFDSRCKRAYLVHVWSMTVDFNVFVAKLVELCSTFNVHKVYVESNAFQKVLFQIPELRKLPMSPTFTLHSKEARLIAMSSHFESQRCLVSNSLKSADSEFFRQWVEFNRGKHDDALDAVDMVLRNVLSKPQIAFGFGGAPKKKY
jgi:predicted phage terminase large subunit-like protein